MKRCNAHALTIPLCKSMMFLFFKGNRVHWNLLRDAYV